MTAATSGQRLATAATSRLREDTAEKNIPASTQLSALSAF
jgi:hypothetical protein